MTTCPRCDSTNTVENATTDIPRDGIHDHGCNDCLLVWDERDEELEAYFDSLSVEDLYKLAKAEFEAGN